MATEIPGTLTTTFRYKGPGFKFNDKVSFDDWHAGGWWVTDPLDEEPTKAGRHSFEAKVSGGVKGNCETAIRLQ